MWRVEGDIQDWWASINDRIDYMAKNVNQLKQTTGPGGWPDFDMVNIFFIVSTIRPFQVNNLFLITARI